MLPAQVDFGYFGPPEEHLEWTEEEREATYITPEDPSSEICGEVAATFAASAMALRETGAPPLLTRPLIEAPAATLIQRYLAPPRTFSRRIGDGAGHPPAGI